MNALEAQQLTKQTNGTDEPLAHIYKIIREAAEDGKYLVRSIVEDDFKRAIEAELTKQGYQINLQPPVSGPLGLQYQIDISWKL